MKKFFTLISVALTAMSVNAQEVWTATDFDLTTATTQDITEGIYADGNAEGPNTAVPGKLTTSIITASTKSVIMTGLSTPNADEMQEVIDGKKTAWRCDTCYIFGGFIFSYSGNWHLPCLCIL